MLERLALIWRKLAPWLLPAAFIALGFGSTFLDWQIYFNEGVFRPRLAFFAPLAGFLGLAMLIGPPGADGLLESAAQARRRAQRQRMALAIFLIGMAASGLNFALMNGMIGGLAG